MNFRNSVLGVQISILYSIYATVLRLMFYRFKCMTLYSRQMLRYMIQFVSLIHTHFLSGASAQEIVPIFPSAAKHKSADQHTHPPSLISVFIIQLLKCIISKLGTSAISIFKPVFVAEQT